MAETDDWTRPAFLSEAHAWIEYGGETMNDGGQAPYTPLAWPSVRREA